MNIQTLNDIGIATSFIARASLPAQRPASIDTDTVNLSKKTVLTDEEASQALIDVEQSVAQNQDQALSVHDGLSYSRVIDLLAGL